MIDRIPTAALVAGMVWLGLMSSADAQTRSPGPRQGPYATEDVLHNVRRPQMMTRLFTCVAAVGIVLTLASLGHAPRAAAPTRIAFVARIDNVYDPGEALGDAIQVDDLLRGTMTYDASTADTDPRPDVGRYVYHQPPYGISIEAGPFIFQTDPKRVDFSIVVSNDHGVPLRDSYAVTSTNNLPLQNGASVSRISWELVDDTLKALDSTKLTATAPDLDKWRSEFGLTLEGRATVEFIIRAHVVEANLCTADMRCPSPQ